ncbi:nucleoside-triphosphatase [Thiomicrospira aerophila AL3]|uniref:dITP/XTP pyrophosphatase n=1 Tax=Thiomicrospira aerophila AL3 TaxID=717772 RepID=W0DXL3_9GAMM|nr:nucleoside-triphosphatase [Thiomicrospira aerophila AL3]
MPRTRIASTKTAVKPVAYSRNKPVARKKNLTTPSCPTVTVDKPRVVLATGNANKAAEVMPFFDEVEWLIQADFNILSIEETGGTLLENAILKARYACEQTGLPAVGDDSGLFVPELSGMPGLYSARFAGTNATERQNCEKLLVLASELKGEQRRASYISTVVFMRHATDPLPVIVTREWAGYLHDRMEGQGGYGYDALFYVPEFGVTAAQLNFEQKQTLSNRLEAFRSLVPQIIKSRR